MRDDICTLPVSTHVSIVRKHIEDERGNRIKFLKGDRQRQQIQDSDRALKSLDAIMSHIKGIL